MKRKRIEEFVITLENEKITKKESALILGGNSRLFAGKKEPTIVAAPILPRVILRFLTTANA